MTASEPDMLWRFLGQPRIPGPDGDMAGQLGRKHVALLAYLALHPGGVSRDEVASLLWPNPRPDRARHNLRQCLSALRKAFGDEIETILAISQQQLALKEPPVMVDAILLAELATSESPPAEDLLDICRGAFLQGFKSGATRFDKWVETQRARLNVLSQQALTRALARAGRDGDSAMATRISAVLMEQHPGSADLASTTLPAPGSTTPSRATRYRRLAQAIGAGAILIGAYVVTDWIVSSRHTPSIAVKPFEALSASTETADLAKGLATNIEHALHAISDKKLLVVTAGADAPELRGMTVPDLAHQLGVDLVMVGQVRVEAGEVEVIVRLLDGQTQGLLDFQRVVQVTEPTYEISKLEDMLTKQIIESLDIDISPPEWNRIELINDTASLDAWIAATKGLTHLIRNTREDVNRAEEYYLEALSFDPDYVGALRGLAWCEFLRARHGWKTPKEVADTLRARMADVLSRRPDDAMTLNLRGAVKLYYQEYNDALADGERAVALLPNSADVHALYAHTLTFVDAPEKALEEIDAAMKRSPRAPDWYHWVKGRALRLSERYDDAIRELTINLDPDKELKTQRVELAAAYAGAKRWTDAKRVAGQILTFDPSFTLAAWYRYLRIRDEEPRQREYDLLLAAGLPAQ